NKSSSSSNEQDGKVVMVIDSSFDADLDIFQGKILGKYHVDCKSAEEKSSKSKDIEKDIEKRLLAKNITEHCQIIEGFRDSPSQDEKVLALKDEWNKAIKNRDFS